MSKAMSAERGGGQILRSIEVVLAIIFVAIAIASQAWQPFRLGFYHDDWSLFVQPRLHAQDFRWLGSWHMDRPGYSIFSKLMLELWDGRTSTFHLIKIILDLATAAALAWTSLVYQNAFGARSPALAAAGAAFWLVAPWSLGYSLWPTAAFTNLSVLFLCLSAVELARWFERNDLMSLALTTAAFGASVFFYQSAWLGIFPFVLALGLRDWRNAHALRRAVIASLALGVIQFGAAALAWFASSKAPNPHVLHQFGQNLKQITELGVGFFGRQGNAWLMRAVALTAIVAAAISWWRGGAARTRAIAGLALILTGLAATSAVYASANYDFITVGVFSRTTQMVDFWIGVGGAVLFATSPLDTSGFRYIGLTQSLALIGLFAFVYWPTAKPWLRSWELQQSVLEKSAPVADALRDDDTVLSDVPVQTDFVTVFGAPWDLTAAVLVHNAERRPDLAHRYPSVQIIPPIPAVNFEVSWTPGTFQLQRGWTMPAKRLLLWHWQTGTISTVDHPIASRTELYELFEAH